MKPLCIPACLLGALLLTPLAAGCASAAAQPPASGHLTGKLVSGRSPDVMEIDGGRSRELPCSQPTPAVVTAGQTATITLTCVVP